MTHLKKSIIALSAGLVAGCGAEKTQPKKPNFLFILVDDLGYNDLSCMGSKYYETPNIDSIAQNGMVFTNGYAACQVSSPSRASIMTGKFPARHGITDYIGAPTGTDWRKHNRNTKLLPAPYIHHLPFADTTLAEALKANGYKTFFAGKWHLGSKEEKSLPTDHGFDINKAGCRKGGPYGGGYFAPFNLPSLKDRKEEKGLGLPMRLARETAGFIEQNKEEPFFAYLAFYAVHAPIQTTQKKWKKYRDKAEKNGIADDGFAMERRLPIRKHQDNPIYAGLVEMVDEAVGHVLQTLKKSELDENTIIIFTSDNGGVASGDDFSTTICELRGGKGYQWEGGIRVPVIVHVPWLQSKGKKCDVPVAGTDYYPTILELANINLKPEQHIDGVSIVPLLKGKKIPQRELIWHYPHYGNQGGDPSSIIRDGKWKLIYYYEDQNYELYDLGKDKKETNNVADKNRAIAQKLHTKLHEQLKALDVKYPVIDSLYDAEAKKTVGKARIDTLHQQLEKNRKAYYQNNWQPNDDWWGSKYYYY